MKQHEKTTLGLIVGNRGFFPGKLCEDGRQVMIEVLEAEGFDVVVLSPEDTSYGSVESREDAKKCAALFRQHTDRIAGVVVTLPNFGDERGVAETIKLAGLNVPVLVHAFPDTSAQMDRRHRRDSFCGKMSVCNNLMQSAITYSLTSQHTMDPQGAAFRKDLRDFGACCRVVNGLRGARIGAIGARPAAFNTVRYSERILEHAGISVETIDLFEMIGRVNRLSEDEADVKDKLARLRAYMPHEGVPDEALLRMAKFGVGVDRWIMEQELDATAIQCWTALEEFFGIVPCTVMSLLSESLLPSACEVDITGAVGMLALRLACGTPSAILDWNNNYGEDPELCVLFHCSNLPKSMFKSVKMDSHAILADAVGKENSYGSCSGCIASGTFSYARVSTDDLTGRIRAYVGEGEMVDTPLDTFGGYGVARIPGLPKLLQYICQRGFEHHVAIGRAQVGQALNEAFERYLGWDVYHHIG